LNEREPVIDASPLIHLARAGKHGLLHELFGVVMVPDAVADEVLKDQKDAAATQLTSGAWLQRVAVKNPDELSSWNLGPGETAVIAHALHTGCLAIIDDRAASRCCKALGVRTMGTLAVVLNGARFGLIDDPLSALEEVRAAGMWLADAVFVQALDIARQIKRER